MAFDGFLPSAPYGDVAFARLSLGTSAPGVPTEINCTTGNLSLQGLQSQVGEELTINCGLGNLNLTGSSVDIITPTYISFGVGTMYLNGATVSFPSFAGSSGLIHCDISYAGTTDLVPLYDIPDVVRIIATFTDEITGLPAIPVSLVFRLKTPDEVVNTSMVPINDDTGLYHVDLTANQSGTWRHTWLATGVAEEGEFMVSSSLTD